MGQLVYVPNSSGSGGGSTIYPSIIWRPGVPSAGGVVETWAEVETEIIATEGFLNVVLDGRFGVCTVPAGTDTECHQRVFFSPYTADLSGTANFIVMEDGAVLRNPFTFKQCTIRGAPTIRPFIEMDRSNGLCICREGGQIELQAGATVPAVNQSADFCELAQFEGATVSNSTGNPALSVWNIEPGLTLLHAIISLAGTTGAPAYTSELYQGDATTICIQIFDSSAAQVVQTNFLGFTVSLPMSFAGGTRYDDSLVEPSSFGLTNVQSALDYLKNRQLSSGPTASRPAVGVVAVGAVYFDTDLGIPIWSNGVDYVDATGSVV